MLKKIKTLLDSGCWVEAKFKEKKQTNLDIVARIVIVSYDEDFFISKGGGRGELKDKIILSIKPIARPLYGYKVGDKVVVLDNYEGENFEIGKEYMVVGQVQGNVNLTKDKTINETFPVDVRCVAPSGKEQIKMRDYNTLDGYIIE